MGPKGQADVSTLLKQGQGTGTRDRAKRLDAAGRFLEHLDEDDGLVVLGRWKMDRPSVEQAAAILPEYAEQILAVLDFPGPNAYGGRDTVANGQQGNSHNG